MVVFKKQKCGKKVGHHFGNPWVKKSGLANWNNIFLLFAYMLLEKQPLEYHVKRKIQKKNCRGELQNFLQIA